MPVSCVVSESRYFLLLGTFFFFLGASTAIGGNCALLAAGEAICGKAGVIGDNSGAEESLTIISTLCLNDCFSSDCSLRIGRGGFDPEDCTAAGAALFVGSGTGSDIPTFGRARACVK